MGCQRLVILLTVLVNLSWTPVESWKVNVEAGSRSDPHAVLADRASEMMAMMRAVDASDRSLTTYFKTKKDSWTRYRQRVEAEPTLYCSDHEGLLSDLKQQQTEIELIIQGLNALSSQLTQIRQILTADRGEQSGLHCEVVPKPPICTALDNLEARLQEQITKKDQEKKLVDDEIKVVNEYDCNCQYEAWKDAWTPCTVTCGPGTKTETRKVKWEKRNNGEVCDPTQATRTEDCNEECCPVDCVMEDWTEWTACPDTACSGAPEEKKRQKRERGVATAATCNGKACPKERIQYRECNIVDDLKAKIAQLTTALNDKCPKSAPKVPVPVVLPAKKAVLPAEPAEPAVDLKPALPAEDQ